MEPRSDFTPDEQKILQKKLEWLVDRLGTQTAVAAALGVKQGSVSAVLLGKHTLRYSTAERLAAACGVTVDELLGKRARGEMRAPRPDDRYHGRSIVVSFARQAGYHASAVAHLQRLSPSSDPPPRWWLQWLERFETEETDPYLSK